MTMIKTAGKRTLGFLNAIRSMIAGFVKNLTPTETLDVGGVKLTQQEIVAKLQNVDAIYDAIATARTALEAAVAAKRAIGPGTHHFLTDLDEALRQKYGRLSSVLPEFGIGMQKPHKVQSPQDKVISSSLGQQTRRLHGVMGPNQRAAITAEGKPGLVLVDAKGQPIPGALVGPTPPGSGTPVEASLVAPQSPASPSGGETAAPSGTPSGK